MKDGNGVGLSPRAWIVLLSMLGGGFFLALLSAATANTSLFGEHYPRLLGVGVLVLAVLIGLIVYQLWMLYRKLKDHVFGSKLTLKLVILFVTMAVAPGTLVYAVSVRFLSDSIESWFDVNVDKALGSGVALGRTAFDSLLDDLEHKGEAMASELADSSALDETTMVYHLREQFGVQEATLMSKTGEVLAFSTARNDAVMPEQISMSGSIIHQIRSQRPYRIVENLPGKGVYLRVVVPVNRVSFAEDLRALQLIQPVSREMSINADSVEEAYRGYQELLLARNGLKKIYRLNLSLVLLVTLLTAIIMAFVISDRLGAPLGVLARSALAVGAGDLSVTAPVNSNDEIGLLSQSFNTMTEQLKEAERARHRHQVELMEAKVYQETLLSNLSTGVLVFDNHLSLKSVNNSAEEQLGVRSLHGLSLGDWKSRSESLSPIATYLEDRYGQAQGSQWEGEFDHVGLKGKRKFHFRGNRLPIEQGGDHILVFDDITQMVKVQRDAAWGEVARRLAHEIKNPLTPIQLAAERLQHRLVARLPGTDAELLQRSTATIINQVDALKNMVNDFSEYARSSRMLPGGLDLNHLIRDVLVLYEDMSERTHVFLDANLPLLDGDGIRIRQVIHNLIQNSIDALHDKADPQLTISTKCQEDYVVLTVQDNGPGFSEQVREKLFEPYATTKVKGTGLGLAIVKKIIEEHQGQIIAENLVTGGAMVQIRLPLKEFVL